MNAAESPLDLPANDVIEWLASTRDETYTDRYWWISLVDTTVNRATTLGDRPSAERLGWFRAAVAALEKAQDVGAMDWDDAVIRRLNLYAVLMRVIPGNEREGVLNADDVASLFVSRLPVSWDDARALATRWQTEPRAQLLAAWQADIIRLRLIKNELTPLATFAAEITSPELRAETERWLELLPDLP